MPGAVCLEPIPVVGREFPEVSGTRDSRLGFAAAQVHETGLRRKCDGYQRH
jgi:hypothetical protein